MLPLQNYQRNLRSLSLAAGCDEMRFVGLCNKLSGKEAQRIQLQDIGETDE
jgi:hypothetical protein